MKSQSQVERPNLQSAIVNLQSPIILYNTITQKIVSRVFRPGEKFDRPMSPSSPIVQLEYLNTPPPPYNTATQLINSKWVTDLELLQYRLEWSVRDKTPAQLEAEELAAIEAEDNYLDPVQVKEALQSVIAEKSDAEKLKSMNLFKGWRPGEKYAADETGALPVIIRRYKSRLFRITTPHIAEKAKSPEQSKELYSEIIDDTPAPGITPKAHSR